jgi:hypothetical protein
MNKDNQHFLKEVFYQYWMDRVPELEEFEAIDHLAYDLLAHSLTSAIEKKELKKFLEEKKVKFEVGK